jgi:hypothetical protein
MLLNKLKELVDEVDIFVRSLSLSYISKNARDSGKYRLMGLMYVSSSLLGLGSL